MEQPEEKRDCPRMPHGQARTTSMCSQHFETQEQNGKRDQCLDQRARQNTQRMLESLFTRLGYTAVTVTFDSP